jgi:anti-sigma factor RsiW
MSESRTTESLVAYLDGELTPSESQQIEQQLAQDGDVRKQVDGLVRTWDMLDSLDEVRASENFTNKTLTSIEAARSTRHQTVHRLALFREWIPTFAICLGIVAAITIGFVSTRFDNDKRQFEMLRHLPLMENLHIYEDVDVPLAKQLKDGGLFDE